MPIDRDLAEDLLAQARKLGAIDADVMAVEGTTFSTRVRLGSVEKLEQARERRLGLRVIVDQRTAVSSTADLSRASLDELVSETCARAVRMAPDPHAGLPAKGQGIASVPDLDLFDGQGVTGVHAIERILWADQTRAEVIDFEKPIKGYKAAAFPKNKPRRKQKHW